MTLRQTSLAAAGADPAAALTSGIATAFLAGAIISIGAVVAAFFVRSPAGAAGGAPPAALKASLHTRSSATAMPWPTPMHMVESERRPPESASSSAAVPVMRAPDMPSGWPSAMAPPLALTRGSSSAMPSRAERRRALARRRPR